jgi:hypothetical protein
LAHVTRDRPPVPIECRPRAETAVFSDDSPRLRGTSMHKFDAGYELFEGLLTRLIVVVLGSLTLYALVAAGIELIADLRLGGDFIEKELCRTPSARSSPC